MATRKKYYDFIAEYLVKNDDYSNMMLPSSVGIPDQILNTLMSQLITLNSQKVNLIKGKQSENPMVKKLSIEIDNLKNTISENISGVRKTTEISLEELNKRIGKIEAEISNLPRTQRLLGGMERKFSYNSTVYNYLMEKRSEAKIAKASNLPDNEIIEPASGSGPISPNKMANYIIALLLGLIMPYGFLWIKSILNNKIVNQENLEQLTDVPVLGKILHNNKKTSNVMFTHPNSSIAESFRVLRTNLEYYVRGGHQKVIMVTSCIEGEGKSFNSLNIAMSYAQFSRKTILVDFDMRKATNYFDKNGEQLIGLSSYLINKATLEDVIIKSPHEFLDYIPSGPIPPNPVELIGLERTEKLIKLLKSKYDYIILDTPPLAQVTDAYLLIDFADVKVLIARYNYSIKKVFSLIMKDLKQKNIQNFCIVLNDNRVFGDQYGYGYGYNKDKN
jgi:capsular exopolysaccharide synthesis family protein